GLLILADVASWPSAAQAHRANSGFIAPNLDINVQFHRDGREEQWLLADGVSAVAEDGLIGFRSQVWSDTGRLLASGAGQLLCRPVPASGPASERRALGGGGGVEGVGGGQAQAEDQRLQGLRPTLVVRTLGRLGDGVH